MEKKSIIWGHTVSYDYSVHQGIYYLSRQIDAQQAEVFFDHAYSHGFAVFEDHMGYKFKLVHHGGEYQLVKP